MPPQKLALISVFDKTGVELFARKLIPLGFKIISTGQTALFLKSHGVPVQEISEYTGFPEILEGRVKTLHPKIHAGVLARPGCKEDQKSLNDLGIAPIHLVVVNLYPFEKTPNIENIDIGGPSLLRAAAKNFETVTVVCDPADYEEVLAIIAIPPEAGEAISLDFRKKMAAKVFALTAKYETAIAHYFSLPFARPERGRRIRGGKGGVDLPPLDPLLIKEGNRLPLRYGENPHQKATWCVDPALALWDAPLQGKELSYNNILDSDAAWWLIHEFKEEPFACAIIKHTSPCGVAVSQNSLAEAFEKALACDSLSAFGGIVALNGEVDEICASALAKIFLEVILAPAFSKKALVILAAKKNLRLLVTKDAYVPPQRIRSAGGGLLEQETDLSEETPSSWQVKTKRKPTNKEMKALQFAWKVCKHVKSNAIVFAGEDQTLGIGAGQMSRIDAVKVAVMKFKEFFSRFTIHDSRSTVVVASDAFFPFPDSIEEIAKAGATAVIQPGGSIKDAEVIAAANNHNLAMPFTGVRYFRH